MENAKGNKKLMQMAKKQKAKLQINTKYNVMQRLVRYQKV